jgi:hypothetical protein
MKAAPQLVKEEEEQKKGVKRNRSEGGGKPPSRKRRVRKHKYITRSDGRPPEMSQIHVNFAQLSVDFIRRDQDCSQRKLVDHFNSSQYTTHEYARVASGIPRSNKADNFFNNGYFKMEDLKKIASGVLVMPIPLLIDLDGREYSRYEEDGDAGDDTAAAAGGGGSGDTTAVGGGGRDGRDEGGTDAAGGAAAGGDGQDGRRLSRRGHACAGGRRAPLRGGRGRSPIRGGSGLAGGGRAAPKIGKDRPDRVMTRF